MSTTPYQFLLTDVESQLLLAFEESPRLEQVARHLRRDPTVVSKQLKRISQKADVLAKVSGHWVLTETGKKLNQSSRDYLMSQTAYLRNHSHIRLGSTREFGSRLIGKNIGSLTEMMKDTVLALSVYEQGVETSLLNGEIDIGFDCGRPSSPEISYKLIWPETVLAVASPKFLHDNRASSLSGVFFHSHVLCPRLSPGLILGERYANTQVSFVTNDIAVAREICIAHKGWALLPKYTVEPELKAKTLVPIGDREYSTEKYGVWRLRSRAHIEPYFARACEWFRKIAPQR